MVLFLYTNENYAKFENLTDIELSYNNCLDIKCAIQITAEFFDVNAATIVKHNTPCGVALGKSLNDA